MEKMNIEFSPLLKIEGKKIVVADSNNKAENKVWGECHGVYIWGFVDDYNKFIPYYVGMSGCKTTLDRIKTHYKSLECAGTYRIITRKYFYGSESEKIVPFYRDHLPNYAVDRKKQIEKNETAWVDSLIKEGKIITDYLYYLNNLKFLGTIDNKITKKYPASKLPKDYTEQYLTDSLHYMKDKFRFTHWDIKTSMFKEDFDQLKERCNSKRNTDLEEFMETFEALVKFSLAGKTTGASITPQTMIKRMKDKIGSQDYDIIFPEELKYLLRNIQYRNTVHSKEELEKLNPYKL